jgi:hypothetical protein
LDQEALRIYERAYAIGLATERPDDPPITFSTVALALLTGHDDETCRWFAEESRQSGPAVQRVRDGLMGADEALTAVEAPPGKPSNPRLSNDMQLLTASARAVLGTAEEWANRVGGSDIGVRHLVATYVLNPPAAHRKQMNDWGFHEIAWRTRFFEWVANRYTAEAWSDASAKVAPTKAVAAFETQKVKGASIAFPGDDQAMRVLERAAVYHAHRSDTWLRMRTVLHAVVEQIRSDAPLQSTIAPIWNALIEVQDKYQHALREFLPEHTTSQSSASFETMDISPRVLNGLETARGLAQTTQDTSGKIGVLHLAAAFLSRRVDGDEDWQAMGFAPQSLRQNLIQHVTQMGYAAEIWHEAMGEVEVVTVGRPVELNSDEPEAVVRSDKSWTSDPLGIRPDVESFAALLASRSLEPPLAIGLFGPWGSGKTTFLKRLRLAIDQRVRPTTPDEKLAVKASSPPDTKGNAAFVENVVHVEFNAWHFAEDALISSLVDTIVRSVRTYLRDDYPPIGQALAELKSEQAASARRKTDQAQRAESDARKRVAQAIQAVADCQARARDEATSMGAAVRAAWSAARQNLQQSPTVQETRLLDRLGETVASMDDLKTRMAAMGKRQASWLNGLNWPRTVLFAVAIMVLPAIVAWVTSRLLAFGQVGQGLASVSSMFSLLLVWLQVASRAASKFDLAMAEISTAYEKQIREDAQILQAEKRLGEAKSAAEAATESLKIAQNELRHAEAEVASVALPAQVWTLVSGRTEDKTYARELTTISIAREDLQKLSQLLREQRSDQTGPRESAFRPVDRVILYIDDLDRCKPEDVVRVLQVVHMLLAFELFVVVVAVDARWVEESLMQNYHWLRVGEAPGKPITDAISNAVSNPTEEARPRVTPQDYLEKIFQISFWLEPMTAARAAEYLKSLVRPPQDGGSPMAPIAWTTAFASQAEAAQIKILPIELDYMRALAAYVGPSPRRVKRLVNAYRLLKARLSDTQLRSFVTDRRTDDGEPRSGPYQLAIGLLVIGTGAPASASQILGELAQCNPADSLDKIIETFRQRAHPDWTMAAKVLETLMRTQRGADASELRGWARKVGRFLLQGPT